MKISTPTAPATALALIKPYLQQAMTLRGYRASSLRLAPPQRDYVLTANDLLQGASLNEARPANWRYFIFSDGVAIADAQLAVHGDRLEFAGISFGPSSAGAVGALLLAERSTHPHQQAFERRLLLVPALRFSGLWLHAMAEGIEDVLIPIAPTPSEVAPPRLHESSSLLPQLRHGAEALSEPAENPRRWIN